MRTTIAFILLLSLPLAVAAQEGWRSWDRPEAVEPIKSTTNWVPDAPVAISTHPMATAMHEEGFPPRSAALAAKEKETVKKESSVPEALPVKKKEKEAPASVAVETPAVTTSVPVVVAAPVTSGYVLSGGNYTSGSCSSGSCSQPTTSRSGLFRGRR